MKGFSSLLKREIQKRPLSQGCLVLLHRANRLSVVVVLELGLEVLLELKDRRNVSLHTLVLFFLLIGVEFDSFTPYSKGLLGQ